MTSDERRYRRRPGLAWREEKEAEREVLEKLGEGGDVLEEGTLIVVDSGQIFELNLLGAEIWKLCDGEHSFNGIVDALLGRFEVERGMLEEDVRGFLGEIEERGWLERA